MITVGDYVVLKKNILIHKYGFSTRGCMFPLKVRSIKECRYRNEMATKCKECPGYINNICFGYADNYIIEPIRDWDE